MRQFKKNWKCDLEAALNEIEVHAYLLFIYFWGRVGGKNTGVSCH